LREANDYDDVEEKEEHVAEVSAARRLFEGHLEKFVSSSSHESDSMTIAVMGRWGSE